MEYEEHKGEEQQTGERDELDDLDVAQQQAEEVRGGRGGARGGERGDERGRPAL
jgi:hypothetical protein